MDNFCCFCIANHIWIQIKDQLRTFGEGIITPNIITYSYKFDRNIATANHPNFYILIFTDIQLKRFFA